jgi:hypothetical protein
MKEIINSILDSTKERLKNPLLGSFVISWVIFNWKPIFYMILSNESIENKIDFISECYSSMYFNFWFPLFFSIFYIVIFPYILWGFDKLTSKGIIGRKENVLELNISDLKNKKRIAVEESELENIKASYRDKADLNKKIEILNGQLNEKDEIIAMQDIDLNSLRTDLSNVKELLKSRTDSNLTEKAKKDLAYEYHDFRNSDIYEFFREIGSEISRRNSIPSKTDDLVIEKYKHSGLIQEVRDEKTQRTYYKFTNKGEYFWKRYIMNIRVTKKMKEKDDDLPF